MPKTSEKPRKMLARNLIMLAALLPMAFLPVAVPPANLRLMFELHIWM